MSSERPHGQMIGDELHRWQGDPEAFEKRRKRRLKRPITPSQKETP